ncbi:MAG: 4-(cytidine 5'-diphospho)-2-C-methyl-D-erythritol kinase [Comamonadaceae bacterium]|nr:MAG: 4-(cytidine 5'-diphospho)-2-C-methyl-D-erythritol kinase [Comamonadaceae bacterium]
MKALYDLPAPAKLNLFLHITGRREDGYHLLQSVFMLIDWCDTLHVERREDGLLSREDLTTPLPADDLVLRAARALQSYAQPGQGAHIGIAKSVPAQAGMGGGSSDAATCLLALNRLWNLKLPLEKLEQIGLALGADVPFFLRGSNAWVEGIGETITPIELPPARFWVVKPPEGLDTRLIFAAPELQRATPAAILAGFAAKHGANDLGMFDFGRNDLQPVAQRLCPSVTQAIEWLGSHGLQGRMTGSGSAVFATMPHDADLADAPDVPTGWLVRQCSNMAVHPLAGWAASDIS